MKGYSEPESGAYEEPLLLKLVAEGNEPAFRQLFNLYWDQAYGVALRITRSPEQARDLAQEIFVKVWMNRSRLTTVQHFPAFLYTVGRNHIHDYLRSKVFRADNTAFLEDYAAYDDATPLRMLENKELAALLQQAVAQLPAQVRQVFTLVRMQGLKHEEAARILNITPQSSKTYMVRALLSIRQYLEKHGGSAGVLLFFVAILSSQKKF
ncbi:RNA polymerase sigma factor [Chitinophaga solisilvae]|uniref:Sigma-70 family RNA polymerase sigma factor n=1 Tax=Chitinophaga solisilvae TaxID=1233460 RepID=A0A9Q5GV90_9BACT|nr:sigma-70 family RNA polymerase sigma factor [Chitinophaga solisilvae]NSL90936.1 sigma-70 family RNA polymerase sigma factor [Chitinophaga solisilvae]